MQLCPKYRDPHYNRNLQRNLATLQAFQTARLARWNAHVKDKLEHRLHELVCQGKLDLPTAQHDIAADWIGAYKKYVGTADPRFQ